MVRGDFTTGSSRLLIPGGSKIDLPGMAAPGVRPFAEILRKHPPYGMAASKLSVQPSFLTSAHDEQNGTDCYFLRCDAA